MDSIERKADYQGTDSSHGRKQTESKYVRTLIYFMLCLDLKLLRLSTLIIRATKSRSKIRF
jgi:hypothetical protein